MADALALGPELVRHIAEAMEAAARAAVAVGATPEGVAEMVATTAAALGAAARRRGPERFFFGEELLPTVSMEAEVFDMGGTVGDDWACEVPEVVPERAKNPTEAKLQGVTNEGYADGSGAVGQYPTEAKL